jgi:hypothetical protein
VHHPVCVEVIHLRLHPGGQDAGCAPTVQARGGAVLAYRYQIATLPAGDTPDQLARHLAGGVGEPHPKESAGAVRGGIRCGGVRVVHSTSWRYDPTAGVVLTYAALPDPDPAACAQLLLEPSVVCSGDPLAPAPPLLHDHHVAAHAVRHLADLAERDPAVAATTADPDLTDLWAAILATAARTPTGTHAQAHRSAHTARIG